MFDVYPVGVKRQFNLDVRDPLYTTDDELVCLL